MRAALLAALLLALPAAAQEDTKGDPEAGAGLAAMLCAGCHDIGPAGAFKQYPPSFASIAVYRDRSQILGRIFFPPFHSAMPQMGELLTPQQVFDLAAYIQSLEGPARP